MFILTAGIVIWSAVHFLPSVAPSLRERLIDAVGPRVYRGVFAADAAIGLGLMVWGYRAADWIHVYDPPAWGIHVNNLLMLIAVYLMGVGGAKGWLATKIRHPMLTGVMVWAVAHLLANGDEASILLFGAMGLWALGMIAMINRRTGAWSPPEPTTKAGEIRLIVVTVAIFAVIIIMHGPILGVRPIPG